MPNFIYKDIVFSLLNNTRVGPLFPTAEVFDEKKNKK